MEGVKRCIVLFLFDRTCEHEQARRARFWTEKEYLAERKRLPKLCARRFHRCFGFSHWQGAFQCTKREIILTRDQSKVLARVQSGTRYVVEILFTLTR